MEATTASVATGPNGETAEYVFVTPELAAGWLQLNVEKNRNVKKSRINGYVRDIQSHNWVLTGEAIKFDLDGRLIDGQNRCHAIVTAGQGAWVLVVRGISQEALIVLDSGSARNAGDMLVITGLADKADAKDVGAIARLHVAWSAGDVKHAGSHIGGSAQLTKTELAEAVMNIPNIEFAARHARGMYRYLRLPVSALGVAFLEFSAIDMDDTAEFFNRIRDGIQNGPGDPFLTLSRRVSTTCKRALTPHTARTGPLLPLPHLEREPDERVACETSDRLTPGRLHSPTGTQITPQLSRP